VYIDVYEKDDKKVQIKKWKKVWRWFAKWVLLITPNIQIIALWILYNIADLSFQWKLISMKITRWNQRGERNEKQEKKNKK
jgi:hypothetical protein